MMKFKIGDVVKHKTTDFKMIVTGNSLQFANKIDCNYFNSLTQKFTTENFFPEELELFT